MGTHWNSHVTIVLLEQDDQANKLTQVNMTRITHMTQGLVSTTTFSQIHDVQQEHDRSLGI